MQKHIISELHFGRQLRGVNHSFFFFVAAWMSVCILFSLPAGTAVAQTDPQPIPRFTHLTTSEGLPNNTIHAIHQDSRGFMWFGTNDGLSRYDGYQFITYKHDPDNPDTLSSNQVLAIYEDENGFLWIGALGGGLNRFDPQTETFTNYLLEPEDNPNAIPFNIVTAVSQGNQGSIWFGGPPVTGLNQFDPQTEALTQYQAGLDFPPAGIKAILSDEMGNVWAPTNRNLLRLQQGEFSIYAPPEGEGGFNAILHDVNGQLWLGGPSGLYFFDKDSDQLMPVPESPAQINAILEDQDGLFWVGTHDGLYQFNSHSQEWQLFAQNRPLFADSLSEGAINTLYQDTGGNIWIGTMNNGLNMFNPRQMQFANQRHDPLNPDSLGQGTVVGVAGDEKRLWLGTGAVLNQWENGRFSHYPLPDEIDAIEVLSSSQQGGVWVGTSGGQLVYFDPTSQEFTAYTDSLRSAGPPPGAPPGTPPVPTPITSIYQDELGIVWIGKLREGLYRLDPSNRSTESFYATGQRPSVFFDDPQSIGSHLISTLAQAPDGSIWIGYEIAGLSLLDPQTRAFTHYHPEPKIGPVTALYPAPDGLLWAATHRGLARFDPQTETATLYTEADGLPSSYVVGVLADQQGDLWISTLNGLAKFDPVTETFDNFGVSDGLMAGGFSPRSA
ncbi:MAG: hypothetical protein GWP17_04575 [Aquificales bacterium]|nr:hypothetical protein [Aquificales bacterium]